MKREPGFLHLSQRNPTLRPALELEHDDLIALTTFYSCNLAFESPTLRRTEHIRPFADKPSPITS
ncbi:MAG TPA: hypothetical protein VGJ18_20355 [Gemmatimonadaceae bacterium]